MILFYSLLLTLNFSPPPSLHSLLDQFGWWAHGNSDSPIGPPTANRQDCSVNKKITANGPVSSRNWAVVPVPSLQKTVVS